MKNKLKSFRKTANLTQSELADAVNCSRQLIAKIEEGHSPSYETVVEIAKFFHVSVLEIFPTE
ncbi:MAG TPA: transcriptional regulator [Flavobacterium sp.]|nr:transcriptional regulator [Flavobacterium sp.]